MYLENKIKMTHANHDLMSILLTHHQLITHHTSRHQVRRETTGGDSHADSDRSVTYDTPMLCNTPSHSTLHPHPHTLSHPTLPLHSLSLNTPSTLPLTSSYSTIHPHTPLNPSHSTLTHSHTRYHYHTLSYLLPPPPPPLKHTLIGSYCPILSRLLLPYHGQEWCTICHYHTLSHPLKHTLINVALPYHVQGWFTTCHLSVWKQWALSPPSSRATPQTDKPPPQVTPLRPNHIYYPLILLLLIPLI